MDPSPEFNDPSQFADHEANSFNRIFELYNRQRQVQANEDVPEVEDAGDLHLSATGFSDLVLPDGARFMRLSSRNMRAGERPSAVLENQQVDQIIVHAAGWSFDRPDIELRRAGSPVEVGTGYSPAKVAGLIQQYLRGSRQAPHCLISRRGDIYCLVPWSKSTLLSVPRENTSDIQDRSISVALEARYTARVVGYEEGRPDLPIAMVEPVTAAQRTALAFIARKLMVWAGLSSMPALTGTSDEILPKLGTGGDHTPCLVAYAAYDYTLPDQSLPEMLLPDDWTVGDVSTLPAYVRRDAVLRAWTVRVNQTYPALGYTQGGRVSDWPGVLRERDALPAYAFSTDLFAPAETSRVFDVRPPTSVVAASNERARISTGEAYQRARAISSAVRSDLYDAAGVALDATVISAMEAEARNRAVEDGITHVAITQSALGFDFETGLWKYMTVPVEPAPGNIEVEGEVGSRPPPAGSRPGSR